MLEVDSIQPQINSKAGNLMAKKANNQFNIGDHLGMVYSGHRVLGMDSRKSEEMGEPWLFCSCALCGAMESMPASMLFSDPPECPCVARRREPERVKYGSVYITYTQDFTELGKGMLYYTFTLPEWAKLLEVDPELLHSYLSGAKGVISVNDALELCNQVGHGGRGFHPIFIPQEMLEHNATDRLGESLRDLPNNVRVHRYLLASELVERAEQKRIENARLHGKILKPKKKPGAYHEKDPLHRKWKHLIARCYDPEDDSYPTNGGMGVVMATKWRDSFECFRDWCYENGYQKDGSTTFVRIDPSGNYTPANCMWIEA